MVRSVSHGIFTIISGVLLGHSTDDNTVDGLSTPLTPRLPNVLDGFQGVEDVLLRL